MGNLSDVTFIVTDAFHPVDQINPAHLPHVWDNCTEGSACKLNITTVSQNVYEALNEFDTAITYVSAHEIRAKLLSRQKVCFQYYYYLQCHSIHHPIYGILHSEQD
jgi:hypothetical protein